MTAQIGDTFQFQGKAYSVVAFSRPLCFHPRIFKIEPSPVTSACWRGFWCDYIIAENHICLKNLYVNSRHDYYPEIRGVFPDSNLYMGHHVYRNLNWILPYVGRILLGAGFLDKYYIHMGYQQGWAYQELTELVYHRGKLIQQNDFSDMAAEIRNQIDSNPDVLKRLEHDPVEFVRASFSAEYTDKAWWLSSPINISSATIESK